MKFLKRFGLYLFPPLFQGALAFILLRWTTRVLEPDDFGAFALLTSLTGVGSALASLGSNYLIYSHFPDLDAEERKNFVSTLFWSALAVMACFCVGFLGLWHALAPRFPVLAPISIVPVFLSLGALAASLPWWFAMDITVLEGRSGTFAWVTLGNSLITAGVVLTGLYALHWGATALFASAFAGGLVYGIGGIVSLFPYLRFRWNRKWLREMLKVGPISSLGNFSESSQSAMERSLLAAHTGLGPLGLYNFAQQFRQMAFLMVKAGTRSIWPITIQENKSGDPLFRKTAAAWSLVHLGIAACGVFFATLGREATQYLSHGKFPGVETLIAVWMVYLIVKHSGRAQLGFITVNKETRFLASLSLVCVGVGVLSLLIFVPLWGIWGAVTALFLQDFAYRLGCGWRARRLRRFPFQDHWALAGIAVNVAILAWVGFARPGTAMRGVLFVTGEGVLSLFALWHLRDLRAMGIFSAFGRKPSIPS